jgi:hypothetical protein
MREEHGARARRAAAALAVSAALHVAVVALAGSLYVGALLTAVGEDAAPLIVEVVAGEERAVRAPGPARAVRTEARRPTPVALPPTTIPAASEEEVALTAVEAPAVALETASTSDPEAAAWGGGAVADPGPMAAVASPAEPGSSGEGAVADPGAVAAAPSPATLAPPRGADEETIALLPEAAPGEPDPGDPSPAPDPRVSRARLDAVTRNPSVAARAEGQPFVGRREVFEFLLDHPDFATHVTRALRLARYRIWRTDDGMFVDDGWGATGQVFVVHATSGRRVLYARGGFQAKLLPAIHGEAVVTIDYDVQPAGDGRDLFSAAISSQLRIDGFLGDLVATLANSVATEKAERESRRLVRVFARVLQAIDETPAALYASLLERPDVPRRELEQFRALLKLP